ncbi:MAG: DUF3800 domain-containing protein [Rickettsiales bacterium]|nr:DUF3800 domain-containing protein [Rickettsiales bacterium]
MQGYYITIIGGLQIIVPAGIICLVKKQNKIFAAIDESGNYGLNPDAWGKEYLILVMVVFPDICVKQAIESDLQKLKLKLKKKNEYHYVHSDFDTKAQFFQCIKKYDFSIYVLALDKRKTNLHIDKKKNSFYKGACFSYLVRNAWDMEPEFLNLIIDGKTHKSEQVEIKTYMRQTINSRTIKMYFVNSENEILVQIADMIAGSVADKYKDNNSQFYNCIKEKIKIEI